MPQRTKIKKSRRYVQPRAWVTVGGRKVLKAYTQMNTAELAEATAEFNKEFVADDFKPLSPEMRRRWNLFKRGRGRPKIGKGVQVVSVSLEKGLLTKADRLAKKLKVSRAKLISRGLEAVLQRNGVG